MSELFDLWQSLPLEDDQDAVVEEMTFELRRYNGPLSSWRESFLLQLCEETFAFFDDYEIRRRAKGRLELLGVSCYAFYNFNHGYSGNGRFIKVGSTCRKPEARAYAHIVSSSSQSDIVGYFGKDYVDQARLGGVFFRDKPSEVRSMDRALNAILKPVIGVFKSTP